MEEKTEKMKIKGVAIKATKEFIVGKFGEDGFERWLKNLSPEAREVYSSKILPSVWYPLTKIGSEPRQKICDLFYNGDPRGCIDLGIYSAKFSLTGIYKVFIKIATTDYLIKKVSQVTSLYYHPSRYVVKSRENDRIVIHIEEFPEPHKAIEYTNLGYIKGALELCGYKDIKTELTTSLASGDRYTELIIRIKQ